MSTFLPLLVIWLLIAIPFSFLAYAIFLWRENKQGKYASIYRRSILFLGIFAAFVFSYFLFFRGLEGSLSKSGIPLEGKYLSSNGDSMTMAGGRISINFKDSEKSDIDGTYSYYTIRKSGFYADLVYKLTGNSEAVSDQIMRVDKAIRVDPPKSQNKSTSKNTSSKSTVSTQTTEWKITVDGESIELRDLKNDEADPLNFKMIY